MNPENIRHERTSIPDEHFRIIEDEGEFKPENYLKVLNGEAAIYRAKGVMNPDHCGRIVDNFLSSPNRTTYKVKPPIYTIAPPGGGSLYTLQNLETYLALAPETQRMTFELFEGVPNYLVETIDSIREHFAQLGIIFRVPRFEDQRAFYSITRGWGEEGLDSDGNAARIHEDQDQITNPLQDGFEVQDTYTNPQASINCCYGNSEEGGELTVYNMIPSHEDFDSEEIATWGYGFPPAMFKGVPQVSMRPETGDIYVLRSDTLHSVAGPRGKGHRVTAATLGGFKKETPAEQIDFAGQYPDLEEIYARMRAKFGNRVSTALHWS